MWEPGGCSPLGLELTRWGICPTLSEHAMEKHPLPASLSLPLLRMGTCPVKVILMCALFSTCFHVLGNSETKWGELSSKTSKKEFVFCSFQEHLYTSQTRAAFIPWATVAALGVPDPQVWTIIKRGVLAKIVQFLLNFRVLILLINAKSSLRKQAE